MYNGIKVCHIVATDLNGCIGKDGKMPWHIPADLKRFKELTTGGVVVMGRKTFESLGCKPLPDRMNIVLSSNENLLNQPYPDCYVFPTLEQCLTAAKYYAYGARLDTIWIIGGAEIYEQTMPYVDEVERTFVATEVQGGNAFYRPTNNLELTLAGDNLTDADHDYWFTTWERKADG